VRENAHIPSNWAPVIIGREKVYSPALRVVVHLFLSPVQRNWSPTKESFLFFRRQLWRYYYLSFRVSLFSLLFYFSPHFFFQNGGTGAMGTIFTRRNQNPIISPFSDISEMLPFFMSP